jgi:hypothetical protein
MTRSKFFFDRCCPPKLASVVRAFDDDHEIRHFSEDSRFPDDADDVVWIPQLAKDNSGWVIVSMDAKILKRPHERQALINSGLPFFLLGSSWMAMPMHDKCWKLLKIWPDVVRTALESRHLIFEIMGGSSLKIEPK